MVHPVDYRIVGIDGGGNGKAVLRCQNFPECRCGDDCTALAPEESPRARRLLFAGMIAVAAIGAGLIYWSFQP